jgi:hypothetical protein
VCEGDVGDGVDDGTEKGSRFCETEGCCETVSTEFLAFVEGGDDVEALEDGARGVKGRETSHRCWCRASRGEEKIGGETRGKRGVPAKLKPTIAMSPTCLPYSLRSNRRPGKDKAATPVGIAIDNPPPIYSEKERKGPSVPSVVDDAYDKYDDDLRDISLKLHSYHELAFKEFQSAKLITEFMEKEGFQIKSGIAGDKTAFECTFSQGHGPTVSFNAVSKHFSNFDRVGI